MWLAARTLQRHSGSAIFVAYPTRTCATIFGLVTLHFELVEVIAPEVAN
jgi:hypothetical protein